MNSKHLIPTSSAMTLASALAAAVLALQTSTPTAHAAPAGYTFSLVKTLGDPAPAGGTYVNDFEPGGLNNHGDMAFGADVSTGGEGVFLGHKGRIIELGRTGGAVPGGGTFEFGFLGPVGLNDPGDMVFTFLLQPFTSPFGVNAGLYRYSHTSQSVAPVVTPYVTPAPGGGTFQGASFQPTINNRGDVVFPGIIATAQGVHNVPDNGESYVGLGIGVFRADANGDITSVVSPGDAAPGGGTFDLAGEPWINNAGDVSFQAHIAGEESVIPGFPPQADLISTFTGVYVKKASSGEIRTIVHQGDPAPGGGNFRGAFHDVMNNVGQIVFVGDLTPPPDANQSIGVFLYSAGQVTSIARPGDPMPGGGHLVNASIVGGNVHINDQGEIAFGGVVDTDVDGDGFNDTGLFQWSRGVLSVIARTGTTIPGLGTVDELASPQLVVPPAPIPTTTSGAINNEAGEVLFQATLNDGRGVMLLATPGK
ncbi:MAG TPA: choice-of-anchor tandem repeat NxxGxxAF-containing protein [Verrucomicrobiae bacterium]|nr:choice-of-anchor tandem repeat NxxGxxAF-containing protein [Verrucomicrobiae bacterium]